jgi:hypothetical protein
MWMTVMTIKRWIHAPVSPWVTGPFVIRSIRLDQNLDGGCSDLVLQGPLEMKIWPSLNGFESQRKR